MFATDFLLLMKRLQDARKVDVLDLQHQLQKSQEEKATIQEAEKELQATVEQLQADKERNDLLIQEYRSQLGLLA